MTCLLYEKSFLSVWSNVLSKRCSNHSWCHFCLTCRFGNGQSSLVHCIVRYSIPIHLYIPLIKCIYDSSIIAFFFFFFLQRTVLHHKTAKILTVFRLGNRKLLHYQFWIKIILGISSFLLKSLIHFLYFNSFHLFFTVFMNLISVFFHYWFYLVTYLFV